MVGWYKNNRGLVSAGSPHPSLHIPQFHIWRRLPPHLKQLNNHSGQNKPEFTREKNRPVKQTGVKWRCFFKFLKVVKSKPRSLFCLQILCLSTSNSSVSSSSAVSNHPGLFSPFVFVYIFCSAQPRWPAATVWLALSLSSNWLSPEFSELKLRPSKPL